jgi:hypothetical protein
MSRDAAATGTVFDGAMREGEGAKPMSYYVDLELLAMSACVILTNTVSCCKTTTNIF